VTVAVDAGQGGQDVVCGMRDEHCMMVRIQSALALEEIQEMRHLFQVGWDIRVIAPQVSVVKLNVDEVLDLAPRLN